MKVENKDAVELGFWVERLNDGIVGVVVGFFQEDYNSLLIDFNGDITLTQRNEVRIIGIKNKNLSDKILNLNQHGILVTQENGHFYLEYERDSELSPTDESKWLLKKMCEKGVWLMRKHYGELEEVIERVENFMDWLDEK